MVSDLQNPYTDLLIFGKVLAIFIANLPACSGVLFVIGISSLLAAFHKAKALAQHESISSLEEVKVGKILLLSGIGLFCLYLVLYVSGFHDWFLNLVGYDDIPTILNQIEELKKFVLS